jgi:hypothetical protein
LSSICKRLAIPGTWEVTNIVTVTENVVTALAPNAVAAEAAMTAAGEREALNFGNVNRQKNNICLTGKTQYFGFDGINPISVNVERMDHSVYGLHVPSLFVRVSL